MPAKINLLNKRFGKLLVIEETEKRKNKSIVWKCKCDCGNIIELSTKNLRSDGIIQCPNCGNHREPSKPIPENIINKKFNHLTVLEKSDNNKYKCQCDCEKHTIVYVRKQDLISGHTKSCGCSKRKYQIGDIINNRKIINYEKIKNGHYYYKVKCLLCGHEYAITAYNLSHTQSCGCIRSKGEFYIQSILSDNNINFIKEYCFPNSLLRYDFAILNKDNKVIRLIEFDGEQHFINKINSKGWNTLEKYQYTHNNDIQKNKLACNNNIPLVRIPYWERDNITLDLLMNNKYEIKGDNCDE